MAGRSENRDQESGHKAVEQINKKSQEYDIHAVSKLRQNSQKAC
jgi:hypothetical protein